MPATTAPARPRPSLPSSPRRAGHAPTRTSPSAVRVSSWAAPSCSTRWAAKRRRPRRRTPRRRPWSRRRPGCGRSARSCSRASGRGSSTCRRSASARSCRTSASRTAGRAISTPPFAGARPLGGPFPPPSPRAWRSWRRRPRAGAVACAGAGTDSLWPRATTAPPPLPPAGWLAGATAAPAWCTFGLWSRGCRTLPARWTPVRWASARWAPARWMAVRRAPQRRRRAARQAAAAGGSSRSPPAGMPGRPAIRSRTSAAGSPAAPTPCSTSTGTAPATSGWTARGGSPIAPRWPPAAGRPPRRRRRPMRWPPAARAAAPWWAPRSLSPMRPSPSASIAAGSASPSWPPTSSAPRPPPCRCSATRVGGRADPGAEGLAGRPRGRQQRLLLAVNTAIAQYFSVLTSPGGRDRPLTPLTAPGRRAGDAPGSLILRLHTSEALLLDVRDLQERDRIVVFLTRERGKKSGVAKGARIRHSRFAGQLQPLAKAQVTWFEKEGRDLVRISAVDLVRPAHRLMEDLEGILLGSYLADHMLEFAQEDEASELLFRLLDSTLEALLAGVDRDVAA